MIKISSEEILLLFDDFSRVPNEGLVGLGGSISPGFILTYYPKGIFPWFKEANVPIWFSPNPRWVLYPDKVKISRSLKSQMRKNTYHFKADTCIEQVMDACASVKRKHQSSTWIDEEFKSCFVELSRMGFAHSIEVFRNNQLAGGLYGASIGRMFYGESMFHFESGASKAALVMLCGFLKHHGYALIDCQTHTQHLENMGAEPVPRDEFLRLNGKYSSQNALSGSWKDAFVDWLNYSDPLQ